MRSRFARLGMVTVCLVALLGLSTPSAQAATALVLVFNGTVTNDGPMGFPCIDPTPDTTFTKCPQGTPIIGFGSLLTLTTNSLPLPIPVIGGTIELGQMPYLHGGNTRSLTSMNSVICAAVGVNINKLAKPPAQAGSCSLTGSGEMTGWCRVSTGRASGTVTDSTGQTYFITYHWIEVGHMILSGHWVKQNGQTGLLRGYVDALWLPVKDFPTFTNSCLAKTGTNFMMDGTIALVGA